MKEKKRVKEYTQTRYLNCNSGCSSGGSRRTCRCRIILRHNEVIHSLHAVFNKYTYLHLRIQIFSRFRLPVVAPRTATSATSWTSASPVLNEDHTTSVFKHNEPLDDFHGRNRGCSWCNPVDEWSFGGIVHQLDLHRFFCIVKGASQAGVSNQSEHAERQSRKHQSTVR